eukprot:1409938-Amphidinium_carterae.2
MYIICQLPPLLVTTIHMTTAPHVHLTSSHHHGSSYTYQRSHLALTQRHADPAPARSASKPHPMTTLSPSNRLSHSAANLGSVYISAG